MALKLDRKVYAAFVAGVLAVGGPTVAWNNATAQQETKTIIRKYIKTTDSVCAAEGRAKSSRYVKQSATVYTPGEVDFRFKTHIQPSQVFRIEISDTTTDSIWGVGFVQSDSVGLLHAFIRIQPSAPDSAGN